MSFSRKIMKHMIQGHIGDVPIKSSNTKIFKKKDIDIPEDVKYNNIEVYTTPMDKMHKKNDDHICCDGTPIKKYIYSKINESSITLNEISFPAALAGDAAVASAVGATVAPVVNAGINVIFSAGNAIKDLYTKFKWSVRGCEKEYDPQKRLTCEQRERLKLISELRRQLPKCDNAKDPDSCKQQINKKIDSLNEKI